MNGQALLEAGLFQGTGTGLDGSGTSRDKDLTRQGQGCHGIGNSNYSRGTSQWDISKDEAITDLIGFRFLTGGQRKLRGHEHFLMFLYSTNTHCIVINRTFLK